MRRKVHVIDGLVLPFDLVLKDQVLGQLEGQGEGGIGLKRLPQDGLGPVEVSFPGLQASQAKGQGEVLGIELPTLLEVVPRRGCVWFLLARDGRSDQYFGIVGGQLQGFPDVAGVGRRQELLSVPPAVDVSQACLGVLRDHFLNRAVGGFVPRAAQPVPRSRASRS